MADSNYPPGVTGREYEIAGADKEFEAARKCEDEDCGFHGIVEIEEYQKQQWWTCPKCGKAHDKYVGPDPDYYREDD